MDGHPNRLMLFGVLSGVTAVALLAAAAPTASARTSPQRFGPTSGAKSAATSSSRLCDTTGDANVAPLASQNYEPMYDAYDSVGAQSCTLKSKKARIKGIFVVGTYFASMGPADSETVVFRADAGGMPGVILNSQTVKAPDDGSGSFDIRLQPVTITKAIHRTFWISVQVNMNFETNGQWGWWATDVPHGLADVWENPGNGYELCPTWCTLDSIYEDTVSFQSALHAGKARGD